MGDNVAGRHGQFPKSVFLNGNAVVIDLDLDAIGLLLALIILKAKYDDGDTHGAADEVE